MYAKKDTKEISFWFYSLLFSGSKSLRPTQARTFRQHQVTLALQRERCIYTEVTCTTCPIVDSEPFQRGVIFPDLICWFNCMIFPFFFFSSCSLPRFRILSSVPFKATQSMWSYCAFSLYNSIKTLKFIQNHSPYVLRLFFIPSCRNLRSDWTRQSLWG